MDSVIMEGHVCSPAMGRDNAAALHASLATTVKWTSVTIAVMESVFPPTSTSRMETLHAGTQSHTLVNIYICRGYVQLKPIHLLSKSQFSFT